MSHYDSAAANDMSDRHGHKSNLRPFCCGTPAEDFGGWVVMEIILVHFFFPFALHVGHASLVRACGGTVVPCVVGESLNSFSRAKDVLQRARTGDGFALSFFRVEK